MERIAHYPDLGRAFTTGLLEFDKEYDRGDGAEPHVSDLGKCDLAVWARRNGEEMIAHGPRTAARLQAGAYMEEWVVARIERGLPKGEGWLIERSRIIMGDDGLVGHLDAVLVRAKHPSFNGWAGALDEAGRFRFALAQNPNFSFAEVAMWVPASECVVERAYFDVKTTTFREVWYETGEFWPDTGRPMKRKRFEPYDDFPGPSYHFQSGGYCLRMPRNPDGKHMPYAIAAFDWASKTFVPFGWYDSDNEGFVASHTAETKRKLELTAPGVNPVKAGIATLRADGMIAGIPPAHSQRANGKSWMCGYCDYACALNTNPDAEVL